MNSKQRKFRSTRTSTKSRLNTEYEECPLFKMLEEFLQEEELSKTSTANLNNQEEKQPATGNKQNDNDPLNLAETIKRSNF